MRDNLDKVRADHGRSRLPSTVESLDDKIIADTLPSIFGRPIERENDRIAPLEFRSIKVGKVNTETAVFRRRILDGSPAIYAPVD